MHNFNLHKYLSCFRDSKNMQLNPYDFTVFGANVYGFVFLFYAHKKNPNFGEEVWIFGFEMNL